MSLDPFCKYQRTRCQDNIGQSHSPAMQNLRKETTMKKRFKLEAGQQAVYFSSMRACDWRNSKKLCQISTSTDVPYLALVRYTHHAK